MINKCRRGRNRSGGGGYKGKIRRSDLTVNNTNEFKEAASIGLDHRFMVSDSFVER